MSRKYKFHDQDKLYFISFATVHWIDVFVREEYMKIVLNSCPDRYRDARKRKALKLMNGAINKWHKRTLAPTKGYMETWHYGGGTLEPSAFCSLLYFGSDLNLSIWL